MEDRTMLYFVLYNVLSILLVPVVEAFMISVMFGKEMKMCIEYYTCTCCVLLEIHVEYNSLI